MVLGDVSDIGESGGGWLPPADIPFKSGFGFAHNHRLQIIFLSAAQDKKKNWLFTGSERAGKRAAAIQTLLGTAKLNGLDPAA